MKIPIEVARDLIILFESVSDGTPASVSVDTNGGGAWHLKLIVNHRVVVSSAHVDITALGGGIDMIVKNRENGK